MGLKVRLDYFDKKTEKHIHTEYSKDFGEDGSIVNALGLPIKDNINNGSFDAEPWHVPILQPLFKTTIDLSKQVCQFDFCYVDDWEAWEKEWA